jgi:hypothetical protein
MLARWFVIDPYHTFLLLHNLWDISLTNPFVRSLIYALRLYRPVLRPAWTLLSRQPGVGDCRFQSPHIRFPVTKQITVTHPLSRAATPSSPPGLTALQNCNNRVT